MIVLASTSPTRQVVLRNAGVDFVVTAPHVDEGKLVAAHPAWSPVETALQLATAKALDVSMRRPEALIVGADQVLALGAKAYAKPRDREDCRRQLRELRGRTHALISAVVCARAGRVEWHHTDSARLRMRNFTDEFLEDYLHRKESDCTGSVGGYKIEGPGLQLFDSVDGDHFTIMGLPLLPLLAHLREVGEIAS
ncbi:Maf family protein [Aestuariivirga sp.]|uniref:Maf family protein n=1 Tax=Aestuariivirga sp. TaxID=2650926 RepID=UPI00391AB3C1